MNIPLFRPSISDEAIEAVAEVLRSGWIGLGSRTREFEEKFAAYIGSPHCVGLNSCTSALHLALKILDLLRGSEVVTTALTFVSLPSTKSLQIPM
jgi:perosamine synthetase